MDNDVLTRNENGELSVRTVSATEQANVVNPDDVYTRTVDGYLAVRTVGGSGSVDESKVIVLSDTMPVADADSLGKFYCYKGVTNQNYTHGYVYECVKGDVVYTGTVSFEPASLSGTTVTCSGDDFAALLAEYMTNVEDITQGTITYIQVADLWRIEGKNSGGETVDAFQVYQEDYELAGFTFTGTPQDGDVIAFTCTIEESSATYTWTRINLQPGSEHDLGFFDTVAELQTAHPTGSAGDFALIGATDTFWVWDTSTNAWVDSHKADAVTSVNGQTGAVTIGANDVLPTQTGNAGKFLKTDGTDASWAAALENKATESLSLSVGNNVTTSGGSVTSFGDNSTASGFRSVAIGTYAQSLNGNVAIGYSARATGVGGTAIGLNASSTGNDGMAIGELANSKQNALCIGKSASCFGGYDEVSIGNYAYSQYSSTAIGQGTSTSSRTDAKYYSVAIGRSAKAINNGIAIGNNSEAGAYSVCISAGKQGYRSGAYSILIAAKNNSYIVPAGHTTPINTIILDISTQTSSTYVRPYDGLDTDSFYLGFGSSAAGSFYKMLDGTTGLIPKERLANVVTTPATMPELTVAGWSLDSVTNKYTQSVSVTGVTADNTVFVSPAPASAADYAAAGIMCTAQGTDSLTFTCTTVPTNAITVNVVIF